MEQTDMLIRAKAAHDQIRAFSVVTTNTVEEERRIHNYSPIAAAAIGRLMSAGLIMADTMMNASDILTLQIKGDGPLNYLVVTAKNDGTVRGYCKNGDVYLPGTSSSGHLPIGKAIGKGSLIVIYDLGMKEPYTTEIALHSGEIADDLTYYYAQSEQTPTSVGLGVHFDKKTMQVSSAGGYMVQLLPNTEESVIARLEQNINRLTSVTDILEEEKTPEHLLSEVLDGFDIQITGRKPVSFHCSCSHESGRRLLKATGKEELEDMIREGKEVEVTCGFCGKRYTYSLAEIKKIREELA